MHGDDMSTVEPKPENEMPAFPERALAQKWFAEQIPDLVERSAGFMTDLNVVDDELLALFVEEIDRAVQGLIVTVEAQDVAGIREHAHTLQGMGGTVGAPEISVLGEELSARAREGNFSKCRHLLAAFQGWQSEWMMPEGHAAGVIESMPRLSGQILVVDDELANRRFLEKLLKDCGAEVKLAEQGQQALEMILTHRPDVALVDVMMPGIDGYEVCARVAQSPELSQTLVIMVTAKSTVEDIEHAFLKGAFDYIRKPFHSRELVARVRNALMLKRNNDALRSWKARMSRELEMAGAVQANLFNALPLIGWNFDVFMAYQPSQHVGGDMFDLHVLPDGRLLAYVADVAGHGVASSLISTLIKGLITEILHALYEPSLAEIGNELHRRFRNCVLEPEIYATMMLLRVNPETRGVESLSCGHPAPLLMGGDGCVCAEAVAEKGGMPIGMMPAELGAPYAEEDEVHFEMPAGAGLYVFTDGLVEARNAEREECGVAGLQAALGGMLREGPVFPELERVIERLNAGGYDTHADDCSVMCITVPVPADVLAAGETESTLEAVDGISVEVMDRLEAAGWPEDSVQMIRLLVMEHGANVVKHGCVRAEDRLVYRLTRHARGAVLMMADAGCAWTGGEGRRDAGEADEFAESGRGLDLIRQLSRHSRYFRRGTQNYALYLLERDLGERLLSETREEEMK